MGDSECGISSQSTDTNISTFHSASLAVEPMKGCHESLPERAKTPEDLSRRFSLIPNWKMFRPTKKPATEKSNDRLPSPLASPRRRVDISPKRLGHLFAEQFRPRSKSDAQRLSPLHAKVIQAAAGRSAGIKATADGDNNSSRERAACRNPYLTASPPPVVVASSGRNVTQPIYITVDECQTVQPCAPSIFSDALYTGGRRLTESMTTGRRKGLSSWRRGTSGPPSLVESRKLSNARRLSEPASEQLPTRRPVIQYPPGRTVMDYYCLRSDQSFLPVALNDSQVGGAPTDQVPAGAHSPRYYVVENKEQIYSQFTKSHRCYDLIPTSTKLVVFDTELSVKKAFFALVYNSVRAAPLWESKIQQFVGMLTITDFITILHKYYKSGEDDIKGLEEHRICSWREELRRGGKMQPFCTVDVTASLMDAVKLLCDRKVHRLPVVDVTTGNVLYILTHKRILRFLYLYMNDLPQPSFMSKSPKELGIGTWSNIHTVKKDTKLIEVLRKFLELRVSALPVIDDDNRVVDIYAKFDVINLAADKAYNNLDVTVQEALKHRSAWFEGVHSCKVNDSMGVFIDTLVKSEVHRLVVTDDDNHVEGVVSLSDILAFIVLHPEGLTSAEQDSSADVVKHDEPMEIVN